MPKNNFSSRESISLTDGKLREIAHGEEFEIFNSLRHLCGDTRPKPLVPASGSFPEEKISSLAQERFFLFSVFSTMSAARIMQQQLENIRLTSFGWRTMGRVLGTVAVDDLVDAVVATQREVDLENVIARLHQSQDAFDFLSLLLERRSFLHVLDERVLDDLTAAVEEVFDLHGKNRLMDFAFPLRTQSV